MGPTTTKSTQLDVYKTQFVIRVMDPTERKYRDITQVYTSPLTILHFKNYFDKALFKTRKRVVGGSNMSLCLTKYHAMNTYYLLN